MNIPQITDIDTAIRIYYRYPEIGTKEITQLFKKHSKSTISRLKKLAQKYMVTESVCVLRTMNHSSSEIVTRVWTL